MKEVEALLGNPFSRRLGWALLAFLWQGTLVALLFACASVALRRRKAAVRYAAGCGALLLMLALPIATFARHRPENNGVGFSRSSPFGAASSDSGVSRSSAVPVDGRVSDSSLARSIARSAGPLTPFLVGGWILGVLLLSLRFLAGWRAARGLLHREVTPAPPALRASFERLCERLRVSRPVLLVQSAALAVPTALGAVRPVILLPLCAVTGLSPEALEAVLAHEIAHIRRHDYLVNLLQTAIETLLFYHPAVWWVSHRIRAERENCCDDLAVMATGDARGYARALVGLEEILRGSRTGNSGGRPLAVPSPLAVAANGGSLWRRIARLLPVSPAPADRASGWLAGVVALAMIGVLGAAARIPSFAAPSETTPSTSAARRTVAKPASRAAAKAAEVGPDSRVRPRTSGTVAGGVAGGVEPGVAGGAQGGVTTAVAEGLPDGVSEGVAGGVEGGVEGSLEAEAVEEPTGESAEKLTLSADDLVALRTHGVTPEFLREISALGYKRASVSDLVALRTHGVTPNYISRMTSLLGKQSLDGLVSLRIHGVTPEYVERFHAAGYPRLSADDAVSLRNHGVDPDMAGELEKITARKPDLDDLVSARNHGVTPEFAREMKAFGFETSLDTLTDLRIHGVTSEFVREMREFGYKSLTADEAVTCRTHGVTAEFVKDVRSLGYASPSIDELTTMRIHGVTPEFIRKANAAAGSRLSIDELVDWRIHNRRDPK